MTVPTFAEARGCVLETIPVRVPEVERVPLLEAAGRVLGLDLAADRDYPPTARSVRDGFAVRSSDVPGRLRRVGEVRIDLGQALALVTHANPRWLLASVVVVFVDRVFMAWKWNLLLVARGIVLPFGTVVRTYFLGTFAATRKE